MLTKHSKTFQYRSGHVLSMKVNEISGKGAIFCNIHASHKGFFLFFKILHFILTCI